MTHEKIRPGSGFDASDWLQLRILQSLSELYPLAQARNDHKALCWGGLVALTRPMGDQLQRYAWNFPSDIDLMQKRNF
jgi:hypothetical protein